MARSRPATRRASPTAPRRQSSPASEPWNARPQAAGPHRRLRPGRGRAQVAVPRAGQRRPEAAGQDRDAHRGVRPGRDQRGLRRPGRWPTAGSSASTGRRSTSTAARSRWATPSAPAERVSSRHCCTSCGGGRADRARDAVPGRRRIGRDGLRARLTRVAAREPDRRRDRFGQRPWPSEAAQRGIVVVPLLVTFGDPSSRLASDLSNEGSGAS